MSSDEIKIIREDIKEIKIQLNSIAKSIEILSNKCNRMDTHISFVEKTYDTFKQPLNFVKNKVERIMTYSNTQNNLIEK